MEGWLKFNTISGTGTITEASWPITRLGRIYVEGNIVSLYFDEPAYNNRSTVSSYIKITTPAGRASAFRDEVVSAINPIINSAFPTPLIITYDTSHADISTILLYPAA